MSNKLFYSISFVLVFLFWFLLINPFGNKTDFDSETWQNTDFTSSDNLMTRWEMIDDLLDNHLKKGLTQVEVIHLLGKPEIKPRGVFHYILGHSKNDKGTGALILEFNELGILADFYVWDS